MGDVCSEGSVGLGGGYVTLRQVKSAEVKLSGDVLD